MEDPPAIHAAPPRKPPTEPGWLIARGILAIGGGSSGIAGLYGAELDVWPVRFLGIGLEYVRGGTTGVSFERSPDHDSFQAARLRLSGRFDFRDALAVVTLAGGGAHSTRRSVTCPSGNCDEYPFEGAVSHVGSDMGVSGAIEGGVYVRNNALHLGLVLRVDLSTFSSALTLGPALGVEF